jgi:hypothetical protein
MKKLLSIALAVAMIMSIAVVALAADANPLAPTDISAIDTGAIVLTETEGRVEGVAGPFAMNTDDNYMKLLGVLAPSPTAAKSTMPFSAKMMCLSASLTPSRA